MTTHHPGGAKTPENGAFMADEELWKVSLYIPYLGKNTCYVHWYVVSTFRCLDILRLHEMTGK